MTDKRDSNTELLDNLTLAAKNHYGPCHSCAESALAIFQQWTGTKHSNWRDLISVILPIALAQPHFHKKSPQRLAVFIQEMVIGYGHFDHDPNEHPFRRATRVLMGELAMTHRDDWLAGREEMPALNSKLIEYLNAQFISVSAPA